MLGICCRYRAVARRGNHLPKLCGTRISRRKNPLARGSAICASNNISVVVKINKVSKNCVLGLKSNAHKNSIAGNCALVAVFFNYYFVYTLLSVYLNNAVLKKLFDPFGLHHRICEMLLRAQRVAPVNKVYLFTYFGKIERILCSRVSTADHSDCLSFI